MIAAEMAALVWVFGMLYEANKRKWAVGTFFVRTAFLAPLPFLFMLGTGFYIALVPALVIGSILNLGFAIGAIPRLAMIFEEKRAANS